MTSNAKLLSENHLVSFVEKVFLHLVREITKAITSMRTRARRCENVKWFKTWRLKLSVFRVSYRQLYVNVNRTQLHDSFFCVVWLIRFNFNYYTNYQNIHICFNRIYSPFVH